MDLVNIDDLAMNKKQTKNDHLYNFSFTYSFPHTVPNQRNKNSMSINFLRWGGVLSTFIYVY